MSYMEILESFEAGWEKAIGSPFDVGEVAITHFNSSSFVQF